MAFSLENVVPWGRNLDEYTRMFALSESDLQGSILGCGDGPASFNAELTAQGAQVTSLDPLYGFERAAIAQRIEETFDTVITQTEQNVDTFVWDTLGSVEQLATLRRRTMTTFLEDYVRGKEQRRYLEGSLPTLPFSNQTFNLALCSHFLFLL